MSQIFKENPGLVVSVGLIIVVCVCVLFFQFLQQTSGSKHKTQKKKRSFTQKIVVFVVREYTGLQETLTDSLDCFAREVLKKGLEAAAKKEGKTAKEITDYYAKVFEQDCKKLNIIKHLFDMQAAHKY